VPTSIVGALYHKSPIDRVTEHPSNASDVPKYNILGLAIFIVYVFLKNKIIFLYHHDSLGLFFKFCKTNDFKQIYSKSNNI